jgi:hypothetical protein
MDPRQVSARFAAYVWFTNRHGETPLRRQDALRFANDYWQKFLPSANEGLGRLLIRIARAPQRRRQRARRRLELTGAAG